MPRNVPKDYSYVPNFIQQIPPQLPSFESYRSRLEIGGTFFRSKLTGLASNSISVICTQSGSNFTIAISAPVICKSVAYVGKVTNYKIIVTVSDLSTIETLTATFITATSFTLAGTVSGTIGTFGIGQSVKFTNTSLAINPGRSPFAIGDKFIIQIVSQYETYTAYQDMVVNTDGTTTGTSAIPSIRTQVTNSSQIIEMPARSYDYVDAVGTDTLSGRTVGRTGAPVAETLLSTFPKTFLYGAEGPPSSPSGIQTGPERTLIHLNRSENIDGTLATINQCQEFVGSSVYDGSFQDY